MKANQAFKAEEEAVSPVVGVILMVAITVVLAAVVFVLVQNLGKNTTQGPTVSFNKTTNPSGGGYVTVNQADPNTAWANIKIGVNGGAPVAATANALAPSTATACEFSGAALPTNVGAGQVVKCGTGVTSLSLTYDNSGQSSLLYQTTFP
ncbi:MAG: type IV pilin N-terminal domain-containing protein [bacterium]